MKYTDIKSYEDALKVEGVNPIRIPYETPQNDDEIAINAFAKLVTVVKAIRVVSGSKEPDWDNPNEYKYYPWWRMSVGSSAGFSCGDYDCDGSGSDVGSRLCFSTSAQAQHVAKYFKELYEQMMVIRK